MGRKSQQLLYFCLNQDQCHLDVVHLCLCEGLLLDGDVLHLDTVVALLLLQEGDLHLLVVDHAQDPVLVVLLEDVGIVVPAPAVHVKWRK